MSDRERILPFCLLGGSSGLHGGVKKFCHVESEEDLPTTLDFVVAALGSCLTGTLGGALGARSIPIGPDDLSAEVEGYIENVESFISVNG